MCGVLFCLCANTGGRDVTCYVTGFGCLLVVWGPTCEVAVTAEVMMMMIVTSVRGETRGGSRLYLKSWAQVCAYIEITCILVQCVCGCGLCWCLLLCLLLCLCL
jgi:hypothetical protein